MLHCTLFVLVKESARLHEKLMYVNNHKDCEIRLLQAEVSNLKKEVSDCHVKLHNQKAQDKQQLEDETFKNASLVKQIELVSKFYNFF